MVLFDLRTVDLEKGSQRVLVSHSSRHQAAVVSEEASVAPALSPDHTLSLHLALVAAGMGPELGAETEVAPDLVLAGAAVVAAVCSPPVAPC